LTGFIDDLPVSGIVGRSADEGKEAREDDPHFKPLYVYTHKSFTIEYNRNQVRYREIK
jgi:transmembrane 9 superfamily protein 3